MREKKEKKEKKKKLKEWAIAILAIIVWLCIGYVFMNVFPEIGHPFFYFLSVLYDDSLRIAILLFLVLAGVLFSLRKEGRKRETWGIMRIFFLIAGVWIVVLNLFPVKNDYKAVLIDGETPSKFAYKASILKDALSGETKVENLPVEKVTPFRSEYYVSGGRNSSGRYHTSYYVRLETEAGRLFASYESPEIWNYVVWMQEHRETIQIEYYVYSGILKTINGIDKNDEKALVEELVKLEAERKRQEELQAEQEALWAEQEMERILEAQKRSERYWEIMKAGVGNDIEVVKERLEAEGLSLARNIKYISSLHFEINTLAFWDNEDVYVIKDNLKEEMAQVPRIQYGMSKEDIINALTEAGFAYEWDSFSCGMHGKGYLHTIRFGDGQWVPKGYTVWFSIDE